MAGFNDVEGLKDGLMAIKQQLRAKLERDNPVRIGKGRGWMSG